MPRSSSFLCPIDAVILFVLKVSLQRLVYIDSNLPLQRLYLSLPLLTFTTAIRARSVHASVLGRGGLSEHRTTGVLVEDTRHVDFPYLGPADFVGGRL